MSRGFVALDIDGTVVLEDNSSSPGVEAAVAAAVAAGYDVTLATGRSWGATAPILDRLAIRPEYVVCANGATIFRLGDDGIYHRHHTETFEPSAALAALRAHLPDAQYMVELEDGTRLFTDSFDDWNLTQAYQVPFEQLGAHPVTRVVVVSPEHDEEEFIRIVERAGLHSLTYAIGWTSWLDIAPEGVDKSSGLALVQKWTGFDPESVVVIGDGRNDIEMFTWALDVGGRAVAMGQASGDVLAAAGEVTSSVEDGGVARILIDLDGVSWDAEAAESLSASAQRALGQ